MTTTIPQRIRAIAGAIINDDRIDDPFDMIISLRPIMTADHFKILCLAADLCPMHETDLDSCEDDDLDCPFRSSPLD